MKKLGHTERGAHRISLDEFVACHCIDLEEKCACILGNLKTFKLLVASKYIQ